MNGETLKPKGILNPISHGLMSLLVYGMIFVALMLAFNGPITIETLVMPAVFIYIAVRLTEYITIKKTNSVPRWLVLGSFSLSILTAAIMTILLI
ncbi:hypothetical protein [Thalassobacillus pellis]|uniref:hypothetical protein n=1 Tax=Thalassobacillus pellis TaxID=748008 RepID=UPI001EF8C826|nr:hypothetical protein [Thalassobacillus pellis]MBM7553267.1 hypothetical protein [Thalassobacillus pellis]